MIILSVAKFLPTKYFTIYSIFIVNKFSHEDTMYQYVQSSQYLRRNIPQMHVYLSTCQQDIPCTILLQPPLSTRTPPHTNEHKFSVAVMVIQGSFGQWCKSWLGLGDGDFISSIHYINVFLIIFFSGLSCTYKVNFKVYLPS